jgi:hypothetical protein
MISPLTIEDNFSWVALVIDARASYRDADVVATMERTTIVQRRMNKAHPGRQRAGVRLEGA